MHEFLLAIMATMSSEVFISENEADLPEDQQVKGNEKSATLERLREVLSSVTADGYLTVKDLSQAITSHKVQQSFIIVRKHTQ